MTSQAILPEFLQRRVPSTSSNPNPDPTPPDNPASTSNPAPNPSTTSTNPLSSSIFHPVDNDPDEDTEGASFFNHSKRRPYEIPTLEEEITAFNNWNHDLDKWHNTVNFYPDPLYLLERKSEEEKELFRSGTRRALSKWREKGPPMLKLYPKESQWEFVGQAAVKEIRDSLTLYLVRGLKNGKEKEVYKINIDATVSKKTDS